MWGLSAYLVENEYNTDDITEAASQWLHFIRPDYYVATELEKIKIDPEKYGLSSESSCFAGLCNTPFYDPASKGTIGGCGGMAELIAVEES